MPTAWAKEPRYVARNWKSSYVPWGSHRGKPVLPVTEISLAPYNVSDGNVCSGYCPVISARSWYLFPLLCCVCLTHIPGGKEPPITVLALYWDHGLHFHLDPGDYHCQRKGPLSPTKCEYELMENKWDDITEQMVRSWDWVPWASQARLSTGSQGWHQQLHYIPLLPTLGDASSWI